MAEDQIESGKFRRLSGSLRNVQSGFLIAIPVCGILFVLDVPLYFNLPIFPQQYLSAILTLVLISIFLGIPMHRDASRQRLPWYDAAFAFMSLVIGLFTIIVYPNFIVYIGIANAPPYYDVLGVISVLLTIEGTRRVAGWILMALSGLFIVYALFTHFFPFPFNGESIPFHQLTIYLFLDSNGILGIPMWVSGAIVFAFILFGEFLMVVGSSDLLNDFAMATFGRFRGGPAKVAVVASSLFGSISGSSVANVTATGVMTIPMMKRVGYTPPVAGAIEAAASTGGQLMPPVMGVVAFILAEFLAIPYSEVAIAAIIPSILYYLAIFVQVDFEAAKRGLMGLSTDLPPIAPVMKRSWMFLIPMFVLIYTLFVKNYQPGASAVAAAVSVFILSFFSKGKRVTLKTFKTIFERTGKDMLMITTVCAVAGIVVGVVNLTGMGSKLSIIMLQLGAENLFLLLLITAIVCTILGMGLPASAIYIILAVLVAPSLVKMGIDPLAAHLFIYYFGCMSLITPPIAFAAFAGAAIANASPMETGYHAARLGIAAYIVPFVFVYSPALILKGSLLGITFVTIVTGVAITALAISLSGYLFGPLNFTKRCLMVLGALGLLIPNSPHVPLTAWLFNLGGFVLCFLIFLSEWRRNSMIKNSAQLQEG